MANRHRKRCSISLIIGASLVAQEAKNLPAMRGVDSIPGSGKSPGEVNGYPLLYSCLENSMDRGAWWTTVHGVEKYKSK